MSHVTVLMVVGSLRERSFNRQLARIAAEELLKLGTDELEVRVEDLNYADVPFMNQDVEFPPPEAVERVRTKVALADGLWIVSPEYNHSVPGPLKNLLDWLSRPLGQDEPSVMAGKPVTVSGAGGASASCCMQDHLLPVLAVMRARAMAAPNTAASIPLEAFATDTFEVSPDVRRRLGRQAEAFLEFIRRG